ncbi:MAG TPA: protein phosphatase 2C domain-containing protein [Macromonas sp.]|nr:protein phosphatase 2C domain-containing protein [Macromonas sp.]
MAAGYRIAAATGLDPGDRDYQQDQLCLLNHPSHTGCLLGVVADGMGGRSGGRKASDQVILTARQLFERFDPTDPPALFLEQLVREAHLVIKLIAIASEEEPHSTVAAFLLLPSGECHWIHCGDSRLYHYRNERLLQRSVDHSYVQRLVELGELDAGAARFDPRSNILLSCLGAEQEPQTCHRQLDTVLPGDTLLACSDGLWHHFSDAELGEILHQLTPREACEFLVQRTRSRAQGRSDNISLIVVSLEPASSP